MSEHVADFLVGDITDGVILKITVSGMRVFRIRCAVVFFLLKIVAWISPIKVETEIT